MIPAEMFGHDLHISSRPEEIILKPEPRPQPKESINFAVIGLNHGHIYGQTDALINGGGKLSALYEK